MLTALAIIAAGGIGMWLLDILEGAGRRRTSRARSSLASSEISANLAPYQPAGRSIQVLPADRERIG